MKTFNYIAKDLKGKTVKGKVESSSLEDAAALLRDRKLVVIKLSTRFNPLLTVYNSTLNRVTLSDVAVFTRQFATMITSGLAITDALIIIKAQSKTSLATIVGNILSDVESGSSLAKSLGKHKKVFSPVYVALIRAGEEGGVLDKVINRLADNLEAQKEFRAKVKGALIYPAIVIIGMAVVGALMMTFVIPKLTSLYAEFDADLPLSTKVLIKLANFSQSYWWIALIGIVGMIWSFIIFAKTPKGRKKIDQWKLKLPVAGKLQKQVILAELTRTLGMLAGAGVPILEGLRISSSVVGNVIVSKALEIVEEQVEKGFPLAYGFSHNPEIFPPMLSQLVAVGEETGKIDEAFLKTSKVFEQEAEYSVRNLTAAVEPLVMIVLGIGVAFLVFSIIMPIYNLTSQF